MRTMLLFSVMCLVAYAVLAGDDFQPLNVKTGLWEITTTTAVGGAPSIPPGALAGMNPDQRAKLESALKGMASAAPKARTYQQCITKEQLNRDAFSEGRNSCTRTILKSTGSRMEFREVCKSEGMQTEMLMQIEALTPENVHGSGHVASAGGNSAMNVSMDFTAKWLGASCPEKKQ